jgi:hypothetical protein
VSEQRDDAVADDRENRPDLGEPVAEPPVDPAAEEGKDAGPVSPSQFRLRRAPRYRPFGLTGALIGVVAGLILALSFTAASNYSMQTIAGYFAAILGLAGTVVGLGVAVLIERRRPGGRS